MTTVGGIQESPPKYQIFLRPTAAAYRTPTENGPLAAGRSIVLQRKFRPHPGTPHRGREAPHPRYYRTVTEICPIRLHSAHSLSLESPRTSAETALPPHRTRTEFAIVPPRNKPRRSKEDHSYLDGNATRTPTAPGTYFNRTIYALTRKETASYESPQGLRPCSSNGLTNICRTAVAQPQSVV